MNDLFHKIAQRISIAVGSAWAFIIAFAVIAVWGIAGPLFHYSDTWQLVINTSTTIITFLMVFLIQNTQNRDARVIHLKLDELIRATKSARNLLVDLEDLSEEEITVLEKEFRRLREGGQTRRKQAQEKSKSNQPAGSSTKRPARTRNSKGS